MSLQGKRVLVVEDDALLLMSLQDMLADFGCAVAGCAMALEPALQMARDLPVDLAVLDVNLGGEMVTPVAEFLAGKGVPFVFATGYDSHIVPSLIDRPRVAKPYTGKQLEAALRKALAP